jgi:hypothetical protein
MLEHVRACALLVFLTLPLGCSSNEPIAVDGSGDPGLVPTLAAVQAVVTLDDTEVGVVRTALDEWRTAAADSPKRWHRAHFSSSPRARFLSRTAPVLDNEQLADMVQFLVEHRDEYRQHLRKSQKARFRKGSHERKYEELDLTADQSEAMKRYHEENRQRWQELHQQYRSGVMDRQEMIAAVESLRERKRTELTSILSKEQMAALDARREAARTRMIEKRIERVGRDTEANADWIATVVGLDAAQKERIHSALQTSAAKRRSILESQLDGRALGTDARAEMRAVHDETTAALELVLSDAQRERLETARQLLPRHRRD